MNLKLYQIVYLIVFGLLTCVAILFGILCFRYNRLPEGLIIIGSVLAIVTVLFAVMIMDKSSNREMVLAQAGTIFVTANCVYHKEKQRGEDCNLKLCKRGLIIEADDIRFDLVPYDFVKFVTSKKYDMTLCINHVDYRFVCNNALKIKAMVEFLSSKCKKLK